MNRHPSPPVDTSRAHAHCATPVFAQSRSLEHVVASEWRDALFDLLESRPLDAIYSIAFCISFTPTFGAFSDDGGGDASEKDGRGDEIAAASARASRELFDLLDDHVSGYSRDDSRVDTASDFVSANDDYVRRAREHERFVERYYHPADSESPPPPVSDADRATIVDFFRRLNDHATLPFLLNVNGSRAIARFDPEEIARMEDMHVSLDGAAAAESRGAASAWSPVQLYIRYAYTLERFRSLRGIARDIEATRGVAILPLMLPAGSAWQAGTSQMLWILIHSICALSVARGNACLARLLQLLNNLHFFVWCAECKHHWTTDGGAEYFDAYARRIANVRDHLPIDIVVARCHNAVAANSRYGRRLSAWTLAQLVVDYREFADRLLLRRRPRVCNRYECPTTTTSSSAASETTADPRRDRAFFMRPLFVEADACSLVPTDVHRLARGEWLLDRLWRDVDPLRRIRWVGRGVA